MVHKKSSALQTELKNNWYLKCGLYGYGKVVASARHDAYHAETCDHESPSWRLRNRRVYGPADLRRNRVESNPQRVNIAACQKNACPGIKGIAIPINIEADRSIRTDSIYGKSCAVFGIEIQVYQEVRISQGRKRYDTVRAEVAVDVSARIHVGDMVSRGDAAGKSLIGTKIPIEEGIVNADVNRLRNDGRRDERAEGQDGRRNEVR